MARAKRRAAPKATSKRKRKPNPKRADGSYTRSLSDSPGANYAPAPKSGAPWRAKVKAKGTHAPSDSPTYATPRAKVGEPVGFSRTGGLRYGDGKAASARGQVGIALRTQGEVRAPSGDRLYRRQDGRYQHGSRYLGRTFDRKGDAVASFVKSNGPQQAQEGAARAGVDTRPKKRRAKKKARGLVDAVREVIPVFDVW